jgi:hypothetical protein
MDLFFKSFENKNFHLALFNDIEIKKFEEISKNENILILNSDYVRKNIKTLIEDF